MLALEVGTGLLMVLAGAAATAHLSTVKPGLLLALAGVLWLVQEWDSPGAVAAIVFTLGLAGSSLCPALVAHVAAIHPQKNSKQAGSLVVWAGYVVGGVLLGVGPALFFDPAAQGCHECPPNLLLVSAQDSWVSTLRALGLWAGTVWAGALVALLAAWLLTSSVARRRVLVPVALPVLGYAALVAWEDFHQAMVGPATQSADHQLWPWQAVLLSLLAAGSASARIRTRRTRASLTQLNLDLTRSADIELRSTLAALLQDPELKVLYPLTDGSRVNALGVLDAPLPGQTLTALTHAGAPAAFVSHSPRLLDDPLVVEEITKAAGLTIDHERLRAETLAQLASLRASRARIVSASDAERQRLERNLHDGAQQRLVSLALAIRLARISAADGTSESDKHTDACSAELASALEDLRNLAHGLYPSVLVDEGLGAALELLAESGSVALQIRRLPDQRHPTAVEAAGYFFVAEILRRCARENASLVILDDPLALVIQVETDAMIDTELTDIEDRLGALDGWLTVCQNSPSGSILRAELPCAS